MYLLIVKKSEMMRLRILVLSFICFIGYFSVQAQMTPQMESDITYIKQHCSLSADDATSLDRIYERQVSQLKEIEPLKSKNPFLYAEKRRAIYRGAAFAVDLLIRDVKSEGYKKYLVKKRIEKSAQIRTLRQQNADADAIKDAEAGIIE